MKRRPFIALAIGALFVSGCGENNQPENPAELSHRDMTRDEAEKLMKRYVTCFSVSQMLKDKQNEIIEISTKAGAHVNLQDHRDAYQMLDRVGTQNLNLQRELANSEFGRQNSDFVSSVTQDAIAYVLDMRMRYDSYTEIDRVKVYTDLFFFFASDCDLPPS